MRRAACGPPFVHPRRDVRLYSDLAPWFHLLTHPSDYAEEAAYYTRVIDEASEGGARTLLELGSGGGNNASHLKARFECTLTDLSPGMLELSRALNPECEHVEGDMRTLRLDRTFDVVFVHDAVSYITTEDGSPCRRRDGGCPRSAGRRRPRRPGRHERDLLGRDGARRPRRRGRSRPAVRPVDARAGSAGGLHLRRRLRDRAAPAG